MLAWLRRVPILVYVIAGGAVAGGLWLHEHDKRVRAEGRAETLAKQVDSLATEAALAKLMVVQKDSAVAIQRTVIAAQQKQIEDVAAVARKQTQIAVNTLRETLDSAQRIALDQITEGYENQLRFKDSLLAAQARLTRLAEEQVEVRDSAYRKLEQASTVVYDAWQVEKKRASPGLVEKAIRVLPVVASAVGLTLVLTN